MIGERQREDMRDFLVKAYADGVLAESALEADLSALESMEEPSELTAMVERVRALYPALPPARDPASGAQAFPVSAAAPPPAVPAGLAESAGFAESAGENAVEARVEPALQIVRGQGLNARRKGRWFSSERILVELERSNVILDFSELSSFPGIFLEIELDLKGSNVVMKFPKGTDIRDETESIGSNVHVTHRGDNLYRLSVVIFGKVEGSNLRAKTKALY